jgi:Arc/MetJ-type ribon-helix-helix transcriptional regulator
MTIQITVRLPEENVAWLDAQVAAGRYPTRTAALSRLLTKAQRRLEDEADLLKALANPDPDMEAMLDWSAKNQAFSDDEPAPVSHQERFSELADRDPAQRAG